MWAFGFRSTDDISQIIDKWIFISSNGYSRRKCQSFCHIWDMVDKMRVFLFPIRARNYLFSNRSIRSPSPGLPGSACHPASPYSCACRRTVGPAGSAGCLVRPDPEPRFVYGPCEECDPDLEPDSEAEARSSPGTNYYEECGDGSGASSSEEKAADPKGGCRRTRHISVVHIKA
jgi:hypothetical protein